MIPYSWDIVGYKPIGYCYMDTELIPSILLGTPKKWDPKVKNFHSTRFSFAGYSIFFEMGILSLNELIANGVK
jgi:hypothetical protein